ncbi:MAG: acyltransferase [Salinivirgaceae bacterium]|nr:acyltransferase [Salinivirgaceae bacterium]
MRTRFDNLDSIRTLSFFGVFLAHAFSSKEESIINNPFYKIADHFRELFNFGVPVFFVLSGFLISYLMLKEQESPTSFSIKNFYIRRILRIWPVFFIVIGFGFIVFPILRTLILGLPNIETANPIKYVFFLSNLDQIKINQLPYGVGLGPTWSVSVEEQFYLIWPIFLLLFPKRKFIIPILILMGVSITTAPVFELSSKHTLFCFIYLTSGAFFAYLSFYYHALIKKIVAVNPIWFIVSVILIGTLIQYGLNNRFYFLIIWLIALLIGYSIVFQCFSGRLNLKRIPVIENIGKYTYGLYLYHSICIFFVHSFMFDLLKVDETALNVVIVGPVLSLMLSLIVSIFSYEIMEKKLLKLKDKFSTALDFSH